MSEIYEENGNQDSKVSIMKYKTILADPPWMEQEGGKIKRGADRHYPLMKTDDIIKLMKDDKRQPGLTGFIEEKREHSQKPETMYQMIEKVSYEPRYEMFARNRREGWDAMSNEIESTIQKRFEYESD